MTPRRLLDVSAAARYLGFVDDAGKPEVKKVYRLIESGAIAHIRCADAVHTRVTAGGQRQQYRKPGRVYLLEADCDAWIAAHRAPATTDPVTPARPAPLPRTATHGRFS